MAEMTTYRRAQYSLHTALKQISPIRGGSKRSALREFGLHRLYREDPHLLFSCPTHTFILSETVYSSKV